MELERGLESESPNSLVFAAARTSPTVRLINSPGLKRFKTLPVWFRSTVVTGSAVTPSSLPCKVSLAPSPETSL